MRAGVRHLRRHEVAPQRAALLRPGRGAGGHRHRLERARRPRSRRGAPPASTSSPSIPGPREPPPLRPRDLGAPSATTRRSAEHERARRHPARHPRAGRPLGRRRRPELGVLDGLVYRSNLLGADRALANQGGGNTSDEGHARRPRRARDARALGQGLGHRSRDDHGGRLRRRFGSTRSCRCASATRWTTPRWSTTSLRCALAPDQPRPSIETLLHAFVPAPHVDHTHPDAVIALTSSPDGRAARRGGVRRRGGLARLPAAGLRRCRSGSRSCSSEHPRARAVLLEKHGLVTWGETRRGELPRRRSSSSRAPREALDARGRRPLRARRPEGRGARRRRGAARCSPRRCPRCAARCSPTRDGVVLEVDRSPEAVAFASSVRAPEVSQVGAPCPDHLINTKHKPLVVAVRPGDGRRGRRSRERVPARRRASTRPGTATTTSATSTTRRRPFPIDPAGPRVVLVPGVGIVTSGRRRGQGALRARPLPPRDRGPGRRRRARRLPLAERGRGVRDRVLAARALQARAGAAARRARRARRARSPAARAGSAARPRARSPSAARTSSSPT